MNPNPSQPSPGPLESPSDTVLLRQVAERRPEALGVLYSRYAPTLLALAARILGGTPEAEEVLQGDDGCVRDGGEDGADKVPVNLAAVRV